MRKGPVLPGRFPARGARVLLAGLAFLLGLFPASAQDAPAPTAPKASAAAPLAPVERKPGAVGSKLAFPTEVATPLKVGVQRVGRNV